MDNSLLINTYIREILCSDEDIVALLREPAIIDELEDSSNDIDELEDSSNDVEDDFSDVKIFPVGIKTKTNNPFVIITRESVSPEYTKDGCYENEVYVVISVIHDDYDNGAYIANLIRNKLDLCRYSTNDVYIDRIELVNAIEYPSDIITAFVQELRFKVNIAN